MKGSNKVLRIGIVCLGVCGAIVLYYVFGSDSTVDGEASGNDVSRHIPTNFSLADELTGSKTKRIRARSAQSPKSPDAELSIGKDGRLSYSTIRELALSSEQALSVQTAFNTREEEIANLAIENLSLDQTISGGDGKAAYWIEPFPEELEQLNKELESELANFVPPEHAQHLVKIVNTQGLFHELGRWRTHINIKVTTNAPTPYVSMDWEMFDKAEKPPKKGSTSFDMRPGIFTATGLLPRIFQITDENASIRPNANLVRAIDRDDQQ